MPRKPCLACAILLASVGLSSGTAPAASAQGDPAQGVPADVLPVPGGTAALARVAGIDPSIPRARIVLAAIRAIHESPEGTDAAADARRRRVAEYLKQLGAPSQRPLAPPDDGVPLPLRADAWSKVPGAVPDRRASLLELILGNRHAALAYYGLSAMDEPTRAFLAASPAGLESVFDPKRAAVLALHGRSLRVRGTRIDVPGGQPAVALWEAVVGAPVTDPTLFISRVLGKDQGRLALLYDVAAHLETPAQSFVLGLADPDSARRTERFNALYRASAAALVAWDPGARPFDRVMFDAAHFLAQMEMLPNGRPAGPASRSFWEAAFAAGGASNQPTPVRAAETTQDLVDAAWLTEQVCVTNTARRRERAEQWGFAQRTFPAPAPDSLADILVAVRGFARFNMLVLTLERMGITAPATFAVAVRTAERIGRAEGYRGWAALAQFQSAVAIIERSRFARVIDAGDADRLVRSLCAVPLTRDGDYLGALGGWLDSWLLSFEGLPTPGADSDRPDRPVETRLLAILAGAVTSSPFGDPSGLPTVEWEGVRYRVDPAAATLRRLQRVREAQDGPSLDAVVALLHESLDVPGDTTNPARRLARVEAVARSAAALRVPKPGRMPRVRPDEPNLQEIVATLRTRLGRDTVKPDDSDVVRAAADLRRAADWYLACVLSSIVYSPHLGARGSPALLGGDPSARHDFGLADARPDLRALTPWSLPADASDRDSGWRITGSLLGLDLALGRMALRRLASEAMPQAPRVTDVERRAFTEPVVLISPFDPSEEACDRLVAALARGRARLAAAEASTDALVNAGADVGLDEWRLQMLAWMREHEPRRMRELWSLAEVLKLGGPDGSSADQFDGFGSSMWSVRGQLACRFPWHQPWATLAGRLGTRMVAGLVPDLMIAVAESLEASRLPSRLATGVLALATQDLLDSARVNHRDDWISLVAQAQRLDASRFEDYVAALTNDGPLIPIAMEPRDGTRR